MTQTKEMEIGGRRARISFVRVRHSNKAWGFYNRAVGRFLDNDEPINMGAAEFSKWLNGLEKLAKEYKN